MKSFCVQAVGKGLTLPAAAFFSRLTRRMFAKFQGRNILCVLALPTTTDGSQAPWRLHPCV